MWVIYYAAVTDTRPIAADVAHCAERLATRLEDTERPFADAVPEVEADYRQLLRAIARLDARFAFDRDGRPAAVAAVRDALPPMERDLFDAIVEDHACELAAVEEALYRVALAYGRRRGSRY